MLAAFIFCYRLNMLCKMLKKIKNVFSILWERNLSFVKGSYQMVIAFPSPALQDLSFMFRSLLIKKKKKKVPKRWSYIGLCPTALIGGDYVLPLMLDSEYFQT